jgi:hypothetical protein
MFSLRQTYLTAGFILLFSGCTLTNINKNVDIAPVEKKLIVEKPIVKKTIIKKPIIKKRKKKVFTYKYCSKHTKIMSHASRYISEEFKRGYFNQKDSEGAKAQLFLIESKSQSIFAKNINNALKSYNTQYNLAKKNKCNLSKFKISPINKIKNKIKKIEKSVSKKEDER